MNELVAKVEKWSSDKGLHESDPKSRRNPIISEGGRVNEVHS